MKIVKKSGNKSKLRENGGKSRNSSFFSGLDVVKMTNNLSVILLFGDLQFVTE